MLESLAQIDPLAIFAVTLTVLALKAHFLGMATAAQRGRLKTFINAEDAAWLNGVHAADPESVSRIGRCHRNDLENLTLFAIAGGLFLALGGGAIAALVYCSSFAIARVLHTVAYLSARPLLRRNTYTLGFLAIFALSVHCILLVFVA
ncbi:MAG: MAPEG family protein [Sphingopyxis sp.]